MPFGYSNYLLNNNKSEDTVESYIKTVNMLFSFLDDKYERRKELYQISASDIKDFLKYKELSDGNSASTLNKHLSILKNFFDYLERIHKIALDPAAKIDTIKHIKMSPSFLDYRSLLEITSDVLNEAGYTDSRKAVFLLSLKGLRSSEYHVKKVNVFVSEERVIIDLGKHSVEYMGIHADFFNHYMFQAHFNMSQYLLTSKKQDGSIGPMELMTIHGHLNGIAKDFGLNTKLSPSRIRLAYAFYLHYELNYKIDTISEMLGIEYESAAILVKHSKLRTEEGKNILDNQSSQVVE
ncbi:tyrosine-type recombinase/integrase [Terribacillus saccharophilus]|uniref:tyrosine-type recombinase/integrase n=1 Tax=Terribacillus saccharophilus TaxID=361277 RepID=UPI003D2D942E